MRKLLAKYIWFLFGTKYANVEKTGTARCCNCGKKFLFDEYDCEIYRGKTLCTECFENDYGYCNECGELNRYSDMNDDIFCKVCSRENAFETRNERSE